jgi:hypothetical protein
MRLASTRSLFVLTIAGIFAACSASSSDNGFGSDDGKSSGNGDPGGTGGDGIGGGFTGGTGSGGGSGDGCIEAATLVYVLSDDDRLYSFRPDQKLFTLIGQINCPTSLSPNSMAVDRNATAWVNYVDDFDTTGVLFKVSTADASCASAPTVQLPSQGWSRIGMGFSIDVIGETSETLFVTGTAPIGSGASPGLGRIDLNTNTLAPIGEFTGALSGENAELTGTGDGRLYGFFTTTPVQVAELNKGSGAILSAAPMQGVETPNAWAFSFWGGDFYLYTATVGTSNVTHYRPSDGSVDPAYMTQIGFRIVGAGVSTCAPLTPPE